MISSRLWIFETTSVCMGWIAKNNAVRNAMETDFWKKWRCNSLNKTITVRAYRSTLIKWEMYGCDGPNKPCSIANDTIDTNRSFILRKWTSLQNVNIESVNAKAFGTSFMLLWRYPKCEGNKARKSAPAKAYGKPSVSKRKKYKTPTPAAPKKSMGRL